ncbi:hypothetical protein B0T19DRAFT_442609 [Cercophora scortea]|uniref:Accumulation-associated protein n=1 Tax=Cercophora scortea TaxID=314031 RepID=A0AAE0IDL0_9PEZI|nr:hypothetical protein B0T19DRAFT_442609 [Cercophora scortea]
MKLNYSILMAAQVLSVFAHPSGGKKQTTTAVAAAASSEVAASAVSTIADAAATTTAAGAAATSAAAVKEEEEKDPNEVVQESTFGVAINLGGGDIKTDTNFPVGKNGNLEIEFKNTAARVLRVTENKTPGAAPTGFEFLEPVSYKVELGGGAKNLTLQKVDYIQSAASKAAGIDISKGQIGRLCAESNTFVVGAGVGELEFEADENELTLTVDNMVGEWGIFVPTGAATVAKPATGNGTGAATPATPATPAAPAASAGTGATTGSAGAAELAKLLQQLLAALG